jgi:hypothetical protein
MNISIWIYVMSEALLTGWNFNLLRNTIKSERALTIAPDLISHTTLKFRKLVLCHVSIVLFSYH